MSRRPSIRKEAMQGVTRERLVYLYETCGLSISTIAKRFDTGYATIQRLMAELNIPRRERAGGRPF